MIEQLHTNTHRLQVLAALGVDKWAWPHDLPHPSSLIHYNASTFLFFNNGCNNEAQVHMYIIIHVHV